MSSSSDTLQFRFPSHGDSILSKMKTLREEHRFCDITLLLGDPQGATVQPPYFHGHRVVLAASSDFLRDQFLLHEGQAELSVGVVSSVEVGERLLLSCYTGLLEVPLRELVRYLTAASALQMSQVVEKCAQAISQYLSPSLAFLKLERHSTWPGFQNQEEKDAAKPGTSNQKASTEDGGAIVFQSRVSQGAHLPTSDCSGDELTEDARSILVQRPYLCRRCDRVFQHLESYVGHLKEHKQYLCLVCGKGFSQRSSLTCHIRIHTGVKPFRCPLCHKTFSKKATLQDHLNLTTGDKPHTCRYCAVHFAHKPGLRRHLKDSHGKSLQDMLEEAVH
ncbi:hypothetical protein ABVT39_021476 [Epinephelus coioides]